MNTPILPTIILQNTNLIDSIKAFKQFRQISKGCNIAACALTKYLCIGPTTLDNGIMENILSTFFNIEMLSFSYLHQSFLPYVISMRRNIYIGFKAVDPSVEFWSTFTIITGIVKKLKEKSNNKDRRFSFSGFN